jgi:hypothetical protein
VGKGKTEDSGKNIGNIRRILKALKMAKIK